MLVVYMRKRVDGVRGSWVSEFGIGIGRGLLHRKLMLFTQFFTISLYMCSMEPDHNSLEGGLN